MITTAVDTLPAMTPPPRTPKTNRIAPDTSDVRLEGRAMIAAWRLVTLARDAGQTLPEPRAAKLRTLAGLRYAVVSGARGETVQVYRVRPRGDLTRMKRPPKQLLK